MTRKAQAQSRVRQLDMTSASQCQDTIGHLKENIEQGRPWHLAFLEAAAMWTLPFEEYQGRLYHYLVGAEAFDWLVLAERLCLELDGMVPPEEWESLLFNGELPQEVEPAQLEQLLGLPKYQAYMNYWYGVVVEEALQLAVEEEVRKEHRARGHADSEEVEEITFQRLYSDTPANLLGRFRLRFGYPEGDSLSLTEAKELTYWLFKTRVSLWDPARVASDTRKGLDKLHLLRSPTMPGDPSSPGVVSPSPPSRKRSA